MYSITRPTYKPIYLCDIIGWDFHYLHDHQNAHINGGVEGIT